MSLIRVFTVVLLAAAVELASHSIAAAEPPGSVRPEIWPHVGSPVPRDPAIEAAIDALLAKMSLEEKVGQVIQASITHVTPEDVKAYHLGSVLNGGGGWPGEVRKATPKDWLDLADAFWDASMDTSDGNLAIPIIWGSDAVHGHNNIVGATLFPHNVGLGATRNPDLLRRIGEVTAIEMQVTGIDWNFSPTVAVARDDRWGRAYESWSEDPALVRRLAAAMVTGLQGDPNGDAFLGPGKVVATSKHFLGDGGTAGGKDQGDTVATEEELRDIHAQGYVGAIGAGVQAVMASFSSWEGVKMHGNRGLLTDVLTERMGFDGIVVGDWNAHGQIPGCTNGNCPQAFNAGIDMYMVPEDWKELWANTRAQVKDGTIPRSRLDEAVRRILRVKMRAGLFEAGRPSERALGGDFALIGSPDHRAVARQAVRESLVLLKNDDRTLPLDPTLHVLVAGDGANDIGKQSGGWTLSWQGTENTNADFPGATSIWDGIRSAVEGAGGRATLSVDGSFIEKPDVAVVVHGEDPYAEFQGDRETIIYGGEKDLALLRRLGDAGIPVVSIFLSGRPLWVNPHINASEAFVAAWLPGTEGGGIADVLFAAADGTIRHDFHGKLSFSWPKDPSQVVLNYGDPGYDPLLPLGHGLTYADAGNLPVLPEETGGIEGERSSVFFEGDPLEVRWAGGGEVLLRADEAIDLTRESNGNLALAMEVIVHEPPSGRVTLSMGCGEDCEGAVDVTSVLREFPAGEWAPLRVRLRCFEEAGADMSRITMPFRIASDGAVRLGFADVRLVPATEGVAPCPPR
ncbi:MAG: glycoside hydrolase family 3 protein [Thermoanaerobaculia bacterium]